MGRTRKAIVEYRMYDLPPDMPILCLTGEKWRISDTLSERLHFHNCLEIGLCRAGSGFLGFEGERVPFQAGDISFIPRHLPHTTCSAEGTRSLWSYLFIDLEAMTGSAAPDNLVPRDWDEGLRGYQFFSSEEHPRIRFLVDALVEECAGEQPLGETLIRTYSLALGCELNRLARLNPVTGSSSSKMFVLQPALEYIHRHYMEPCSMEELSAICHVSQTHFRRLFLAVMGTSPLQFLNTARIIRACAALNTTEEPVTAIAQSVGIPSISSFNRNFQQVMGVSPRVYRNSRQTRLQAHQRKYILPYKGWLAAEESPAFTGDGAVSGLRSRG